MIKWSLLVVGNSPVFILGGKKWGQMFQRMFMFPTSYEDDCFVSYASLLLWNLVEQRNLQNPNKLKKNNISLALLCPIDISLVLSSAQLCRTRGRSLGQMFVPACLFNQPVVQHSRCQCLCGRQRGRLHPLGAFWTFISSASWGSQNICQCNSLSLFGPEGFI